MRLFFPLLLLLSCTYVDSQGVLSPSNLEQGIKEQSEIITEEEFQANAQASPQMTIEEYQKLLASHTLVLIDFSAKWCGPCKKQSPLLHKLEKQRTDAFKLYEIDVDMNETIAKANDVEVLPTMIWYKNGKLAKRILGLHTEKEISQTLDDLLKY